MKSEGMKDDRMAGDGMVKSGAAITSIRNVQKRNIGISINRLNRLRVRSVESKGWWSGMRTVRRSWYMAAANAALNSFNKVLLANHIRTCVADDIRDGKEETIDEPQTALQKLMK